MSKNSTSQGYVALLISVSLLIIIQAMAIGEDSNSLERPVLSVSTSFRAPEFAISALASPLVPDQFEPGALSQLPGENEYEETIYMDEVNENNSIELSTDEPTITKNNETIIKAVEPEKEHPQITKILQPHSKSCLITKPTQPGRTLSPSLVNAIKEKPEKRNKKTDYATYTIKKGDSLWMIANKYKTTVKNLMLTNNISPDDSLLPGNTLKLNTKESIAIYQNHFTQKKELALKEKDQQKKATKAIAKALTYRVKKGDTLIAIARRFHTSVASLLINNNIEDPGKLMLGQLLKISEANKIVHVVNKGESLWELGKLYSIKLSKLISHNDLKYKTIFPGQRLTIPIKNATKLEQIYKRKIQKVLNSKFNSPLKGRLCGYYGWRIHPILKKRLFHCGIDIAASKGTPIKAIGTGKVTFAGWLKGYGKVVVVKHGRGLSSRYAHCSIIKTKVGAKIKAGDTIAKVGTTGLSTGPHLHLEVRKFGHPVDPRKHVAI